ncbi:MAG TPA: hypothetical protein VHB18_12255 [Mycobacteriales bacterium]|nr:hypothetical protein [Mycobacteriales bacterium]
MRVIRRVVPGIVLAGLALPITLAPAPAQAAPVPVGHLAFVTGNGVLDIVAVMSNGTTTDPVKLGPVTKVAKPKTVTVSGLVVSADKDWLGWSEQISATGKDGEVRYLGSRVVVRHMYDGKTAVVHANAVLLGFAGHTLVTTGAYNKRLVMKPTPHLVRIPGNAYAVATYPHGIVDVKFVDQGAKAAVDHEQLRLTTFAGRHTVLHTYVIGKTYRNVGANVDAVSPDGRKLLVERGNHQDFDGLGPSSLFDTYSLRSATHARHKLGHYGTDKAQWRLADATFVGAHNTPWLAIHSAPKKSHSGDYYVVRGYVVSYSHGQWALQDDHGIAVAGNSDGYVVVQDGEWQPVPNSDAGEYRPVPGGFALLRGPHGGHYLRKVKGTELVWVVKPDKKAPEGT